MLATLAALQLAAAPVAAVPRLDTLPPDSLPQITLDEAIRRSTRLDPNYVLSLGQIEDAQWGRRAALAVFVLPSVSVGLDLTKYSDAFFNVGTGTPQATSATFRADARYELFSVRKFTDLARTRAELDGAQASELAQRFTTSLFTEADYYDVLTQRELRRVGDERVRRADEALGVARARVASGAAVQTDSLQLVLELTQARVDLLRQDAALRAARLQLGRRVGADGPVDAVPLDTLPPPALPIELAEAVRLALAQGPQYRVARADERAAEAALRGRRGEYLPTVNLVGSHQRFDSRLFPDARSVSSIGIGVSFPIWNNAQREIGISLARTNRDVARAVRADLERAARLDVTQAYDAYTTAAATVALSETAIAVAGENFRVQDLRYRSGATDVLDLLNAQLRLVEAEADLVEARFAARRALSGLEAILGRRLLSDRNAP